MVHQLYVGEERNLGQPRIVMCIYINCWIKLTVFCFFACLLSDQHNFFGRTVPLTLWYKLLIIVPPEGGNMIQIRPNILYSRNMYLKWRHTEKGNSWHWVLQWPIVKHSLYLCCWEPKDFSCCRGLEVMTYFYSVGYKMLSQQIYFLLEKEVKKKRMSERGR